jgi:hypothetical protein
MTAALKLLPITTLAIAAVVVVWRGLGSRPNDINKRKKR